eukprot:SAG31_NODE_534_length_14370_cov_121.217434_8_plen_70_part_00
MLMRWQLAGGTAFVAAGELNWSGDAVEAIGAIRQFDGVWFEGTEIWYFFDVGTDARQMYPNHHRDVPDR